ncbi:copper chaperone PCu(A)C [Pseudoruegeria sp. HB172150]|uniref:copper chaperone PCu(A)C n=1 Tax=Pseudoruegeria sp. HB172150 TaxID=2721164 RepID=UPI0015526B91|nr:copper chaperone PCu(A)C [Pseudoruegeria sp. HB172150]
MNLKSVLFAGVALLAAGPALAEITIEDAYLRTAGPTASNGAAFMVIHNTGEEDDRLIGATSDIAAKVELHTHMDMGNGVMQMTHVEEGFPIPAEGEHAMERGGDHVMLMGIGKELPEGAVVSVTLTFEHAGDITVEIPVDRSR